MAGKMSNSKRKRTPKTSKGIHGGGGKVRLTELEKALMGKGVMRRIERPAKTKVKASDGS